MYTKLLVAASVSVLIILAILVLGYYCDVAERRGDPSLLILPGLLSCVSVALVRTARAEEREESAQWKS